MQCIFELLKRSGSLLKLPEKVLILKFLIMLSTKVNLLYFLCLITQRCFLLHLINQNCLLITFLRTLILITRVSFYLFSPLELIWNCIIFLFLVLRNCEPERSYILAEFFNICLKGSRFPDCWWSLYLIMLQKGLLLTTTALLVFFLW